MGGAGGQFAQRPKLLCADHLALRLQELDVGLLQLFGPHGYTAL